MSKPKGDIPIHSQLRRLRQWVAGHGRKTLARVPYEHVTSTYSQKNCCAAEEFENRSNINASAVDKVQDGVFLALASGRWLWRVPITLVCSRLERSSHLRI